MMGLSRRKVCALLGGLPDMASGMAGGFGGLGCGKEPRHLTVYNWGDYLAPEVLERFAAREGGAAVTQDFFLSEGELFAKLQAGADVKASWNIWRTSWRVWRSCSPCIRCVL